MKVGGQPLSVREVLTIKLPRIGQDPISFKVCGVPIGFNSMYEKVWPRPRPPSKSINLGNGKVNTEENYSDPVFVAEHKEYEFHKNIYLICKGLEADSSVSFEATGINGITSKEQLIAIAKEMSVAGLSEGDINILITGIHAASHITEKEVDLAVKGF